MNPKYTKKRIIALSVSSLLPLLAIGLGCFLLFADTIFNTAFAISFVIVPLVFITFFALIVFSEKKMGIKIGLTVFTVIAFTVSFLFSYTFGNFESITRDTDANIGKRYDEVCSAYDPMPTVNEVGNCVKIEHFDYFSCLAGFFTCDADTLTVHYTPDEYKKQKALLEEKYVFQNEDMTAHGFNCRPDAEINGYSFRTLDLGGKYGSEILYPKGLVFIATNDQKNTVSYTAFYDDDRDYIESLEKFLLNSCGWKHIIRMS